jgi:hypothetical protein
MHPWMGFCLKYLFSVGLLCLLFYFVPLREITEVLANASPGYFVAGLLLQFAARAVVTLRMKVITDNQGMALGHLTLYRILLITQFYSLILPGSLAGGGATWIKYLQHGADKGAAISAIVLNRGIGLAIMIITGTAALMLDRGTLQSALVTGTLLLCAILAIFMIFRRSPISTVTLPAVEKPGFRQHISRLVQRLFLFQQVPRRGKAIVLASSLAHELTGTAVMWCFASATGLQIGFVTVMWMRAVLQVALLLPASFAGLGMREASLVALCALAGIPPATAMAWSFMLFAGMLFVAFTGGLIETNAVSRYLARSAQKPFPMKTKRDINQ